MKNGYNVVVSVNDINNKKTLINQKYDELYEMIKTYQKMIDETEKVYDTKSAKEFRLIAHRYIDIALLYLENDFKEYANKMDLIINSYNDFYTATKATIGSGDSDEV